MSIITLTTDFGVVDSYVAAMKGVILSIAPDARIVDISHQIPPQAVKEAAYVLGGAIPYFPPDTVHVVVVDPGVGSSRRPIAIRAGHAFFVGPD
ncbi:MAG: S-adenosyl-l-methionine hydroxide adenosyltransferase family protein, partial [Anaerolineae bacterium]